METDLGIIARQHGDNIAQAGVQLVAPGVIAAAQPPTREEEELVTG